MAAMLARPLIFHAIPQHEIKSGKPMPKLVRAIRYRRCRALEESKDTEALAEKESSELEKVERQAEKKAPRNASAWAIVDVLTVFAGLLERPYGSGEMIAAAGGVVIEKIRADSSQLLAQGEIKEQDVFELLRAVQFLEMDLSLISAAKHGPTLISRLQQAKQNCQLALSIASKY